MSASHNDRREFLQTLIVGASALRWRPEVHAQTADSSHRADDDIRKHIESDHTNGVERLREWIRQPSIAAETRSPAPLSPGNLNTAAPEPGVATKALPFTRSNSSGLAKVAIGI